MKSIALVIAFLISVPSFAFAWDEDGHYFEQQMIEAEAEAKLADYHDPMLDAEHLIEPNTESDITMRTVCVNGYTMLLTVDEASGNLDVLQMIGSEGFPIACPIER